MQHECQFGKKTERTRSGSSILDSFRACLDYIYSSMSALYYAYLVFFIQYMALTIHMVYYMSRHFKGQNNDSHQVFLLVTIFYWWLFALY